MNEISPCKDCSSVVCPDWCPVKVFLATREDNTGNVMRFLEEQIDGQEVSR